MWILLIMLVAPLYGVEQTKEDFFKYWFKGSRVLEEYNRDTNNFLDMPKFEKKETVNYSGMVTISTIARTTNEKGKLVVILEGSKAKVVEVTTNYDGFSTVEQVKEFILSFTNDVGGTKPIYQKARNQYYGTLITNASLVYPVYYMYELGTNYTHWEEMWYQKGKKLKVFFKGDEKVERIAFVRSYYEPMKYETPPTQWIVIRNKRDTWEVFPKVQMRGSTIVTILLWSFLYDMFIQEEDSSAKLVDSVWDVNRINKTPKVFITDEFDTWLAIALTYGSFSLGSFPIRYTSAIPELIGQTKTAWLKKYDKFRGSR